MTRIEELKKMLDEHRIDWDYKKDVETLGLHVSDLPELEDIQHELHAFDEAHEHDSDEEWEATTEEWHKLNARYFRAEEYIRAIYDYYQIDGPYYSG